MKLRNSLLVLSLALFATACGGGGGGGGNPGGGDPGGRDVVRASGRLALIGPDSSFLGTSVDITDVALEIPAGASDVRTLVFVDAGTAILGTGIVEDLAEVDFDPIDLLNSLTLVVFEDASLGATAVSMGMSRGGSIGRYSCSTVQGSSSGDDCGNLVIDRVNRSVTFDMVTVEFSSGDEATADLILDGVLTWSVQG